MRKYLEGGIKHYSGGGGGANYAYRQYGLDDKKLFQYYNFKKIIINVMMTLNFCKVRTPSGVYLVDLFQ